LVTASSKASPTTVVRRQKAEAEAALLASIVSSSDDAIASKTLQGIVTSWNAAAERIFGYTAQEIIGNSITMIIPKDRMEEEREILARIMRGERVDHFETLRQRKDGQLIAISLTISPIRDADGRIIGASKIARDISERKRIQEELQRLYAMAQSEVKERKRAEEMVRELNQHLESRVKERTAELEAFSYTIAHDLRAPLRAIHRFSDILREDYGERLDTEGRDYLARLAQGAARMDRLIEDLLEYSRISRADIHLHPIQLAGIFRDVQVHLAADLEEKNARLQIDEPLPTVQGDRMLLLQSLTNLVSNSLKFVAKGTIPDVRASAEQRDDAVRITIRDNGVGIAPEHHQRVFQIFERLNCTEAYPGTGVGLAIVKMAVHRMNGRLGVESESGRGSCFWIELRAGATK
jgi:PAS domain S-box-containing protein